MTKKFTVGGLFSGVGGIELGFEQAGFEIKWGNEIDKLPAETYKMNFDHKILVEDIYDVKASDLEPVDVICAGFPCQAFSIAGYQKGFEDSRGNVFFEIIRLIKEFEKKPQILLLENVKNFLSHDSGNTFKVVKHSIENAGYRMVYCVLNTSDVTEIPHNRERTFMICFDGEVIHFEDNALFGPNPRNPYDIPSKKISDYLEETTVDEKYYYREDKYMYKELLAAINSEDTVYQWRRKYVRENKSNVCPTLTANMGTGGHNVPLIKVSDGIRKFTPRECFNLQGFPQSFNLPSKASNASLYKQAGNAVSVPVIKLIAEDIKRSLETGLLQSYKFAP